MKINKLVLAGLLALATVMGASGQTIRIVGSTAYRAAVNDAIRNVLNSGYTWAIVGSNTADSTLGGASVGWWSGTLKSTSEQITIKTDFSGSIAGVADMCQQIPEKFIVDSGTYSSSGTALGSGAETDTANPADFAWTDTDATTDEYIVQHAASATAKNAISTNLGNLTEAGTQASAATGQGIVYFELVEQALKSGSSTPFTNLTTDNLATMITKGYISVGQVTGSNAYETSDVILIGRNEDSGSRGNVYSCAFEGATSSIGSASTVQFMPIFSGTNGTTVATYSDSGALTAGTANGGTYTLGSTVEDGGTGTVLTGYQEWPARWGLSTDTSITWTSLGHSGFVSGGEVAAGLSATDPIIGLTGTYGTTPRVPAATYVVGYLGGSDAATCVAGGATNTTNAQATRIAYNGVQYTQAGVLNGSYGLWGYEHAYYLSSVGESQANIDAMNDIADEVYLVTAEDNANEVQFNTDDTAAGIFIPSASNPHSTISTALVTRGSPGAPITEKYNP